MHISQVLVIKKSFRYIFHLHVLHFNSYIKRLAHSVMKKKTKNCQKFPISYCCSYDEKIVTLWAEKLNLLLSTSSTIEFFAKIWYTNCKIRQIWCESVTECQGQHGVCATFKLANHPHIVYTKICSIFHMQISIKSEANVMPTNY